MTQSTKKDPAVTPVLGVMLLLIITVIIAAIVSSYAGGLSGTKTKAPQIIINPEVYIKNDNSLHMNIAVLSAGDGIPTRDLRLITEWRTFDASGRGSTTGASREANDNYPTGHGAGVQTGAGANHFGNYTLFGGTLMSIGDDPGRIALFGPDWNKLNEGDLVTLKVIHIPSQVTIADREIIVRRV
jgi:hypothetical protein